MVKSILFDLDDTIITDDASAGDCWRETCDRFASRLDGFETGQLFTAIDLTRNWFWSDPGRHRRGRLNLFDARREVVEQAFDRLGIADKKIAEEIADAYSTEREETAELCPGAIDTLTHFRNLNRKLALVTNGSSEIQRAKIERFKLARFFHHILVEGEYGKGKPEKDVFIGVLENLGAAAVDTWMVGDDLERDIFGAQRVGIYAIWVDRRGTGLPESTGVKPDRTIRTLTELV